jgi:hypothetical protein
MQTIYSFDFKPEYDLNLWLKNDALPFWHEWQKLRDLGKEDYINLISQLPEILPHPKPQTLPGNEGFSLIQQLYWEMPKWFRYFDDDEYRVLKPVGTETFEPYGYRAKALLDLCNAVYKHKGCDKLIKFFFSSPVHLWFWCIAAQCRNHLALVDESTPTRRRDLVGKTESLKNWGEEIKELRQRKPQWKKCEGWTDFLDNLYKVIIGKALKGQYATLHVEQHVGRKTANSDALTVFIETEAYTKNQFLQGPRAKSYQVICLYQNAPHSPVKLSVTKLRKKLPGRTRRKSPRGFG